jgi:hypothetical protein
LNPAGIRHTAHQAIERIDLANEMTFAKTTDGGIAGHRPDGGDALGYQGRSRTHARGRCGRLTTGVAAANDNHVETAVHQNFLATMPCF